MYAYLRGYCKTAFAGQGPEPFVREVPAKHGLYGYCGGQFFERGYPSDDEYRKVREEYHRRIEEEKAKSSEQP